MLLPFVQSCSAARGFRHGGLKIAGSTRAQDQMDRIVADGAAWGPLRRRIAQGFLSVVLTGESNKSSRTAPGLHQPLLIAPPAGSPRRRSPFHGASCEAPRRWRSAGELTGGPAPLPMADDLRKPRTLTRMVSFFFFGNLEKLLLLQWLNFFQSYNSYWDGQKI